MRPPALQRPDLPAGHPRGRLPRRRASRGLFFLSALMTLVLAGVLTQQMYLFGRDGGGVPSGKLREDLAVVRSADGLVIEKGERGYSYSVELPRGERVDVVRPLDQPLYLGQHIRLRYKKANLTRAFLVLGVEPLD